MLDSFLTVTGQVATLFLMMGVGFVLGRLGRLTGAALDQLSFLLLYVVCPCIMIDSFLVEPTPALVREVLLGGGIAAAEELGISVCWARFLPGKTAPVTAALAIRDAVYHILEEREGPK